MSSAAAFSHDESTLAGLRSRVESALRLTVARGAGAGPTRLREAIAHAVFSGGGRLRPTLALSVAAAYGDPVPDGANAAAVSVELVHCASLAHDDLPCFDDAKLRRGKPTVHSEFGVPTAGLVGDALIVLAFGALAGAGHALITTLAEATGPARGIIAGQGWEGEVAVTLDEYHRAKTGALFAASAQLGAYAAGADGARWREFGDVVGRAYQAFDDVMDVIADSSITGKVGGRDVALARPSVVRADGGLVAARRRVAQLVDEAARVVPRCPSDRVVRAWLDGINARIDANLVSLDFGR